MEPSRVDADLSLAGSTALITGAAQGIGRAIAELFARKGASLVLVDVKPEVRELGVLLARTPANALPIVADLTVTPELDRVVSEAERLTGRVDILVNNAGVALLGDALSLGEEAWDRTLALNLTAPFLLAQRVGRGMTRRGHGRIINIASQASVIGLEGHAAYCASKAGLVGLARVLALEWARFGVTVNCISPTVTLTELGRKAWAGEVGEAMKRKIPAQRFAEPEEVAAAALYLASSAADMINGTNLLIDGGYTAQ
ncbi:MAG TPA: D-threitol dehydrogenase [Spirochaetia bacterium]|nr:D-threitol dehydrogenase [Spirochaetia bacterium]